jgi:hypothetical protein
MSVDIVFDGPRGRFIEAEDDQRRSIKIGEWALRDDGYWVLRIPDPRAAQARIEALEGALRKCLDHASFDGGDDITTLRGQLLAVQDAARALLGDTHE